MKYAEQTIIKTSKAEAATKEPTNFGYTVSPSRLLDHTGSPTRFIGTRRDDTGLVLGVATKRYSIVQNTDLINAAEALFERQGMGDWNRKTVVTHGGARMFAVYDFTEQKISVGKRFTDDLFLRLRVNNSFDGSQNASFTVGLFRLVCSNGLAMPINTISLAKKHTGTLEADFLARGITRALNSFKEAVPFLNRMTEVQVTRQQGITAIENLVKRGELSERMSKHIIDRWEDPSHTQDTERSAWSLYNAATEYLTHEVAPKRFEQAEKVTQSFVRALRTGGMMEGRGIYLPETASAAPMVDEEAEEVALA